MVRPRRAPKPPPAAAPRAAGLSADRSGDNMPPAERLHASASERLYRAPLESFVAVRAALTKELRDAGDVDAARLVAATTKPTRTAWVINQLAFERRELLAAVFDARDHAARAQVQGQPEATRAGAKAYRERVADAVRAAREVASAGGFELNASQARRVLETLQAASAADAAVRARVLAGRLDRDLLVDDPFSDAEVEAGSGGPGPPERSGPRDAAGRGRAGPHPSGKTDDAAARERAAAEEKARAERRRALDFARDRVRAFEEEARRTKALAEQARAAAGRAASAADRAEAEHREAEARLRSAREELDALRL